LDSTEEAQTLLARFPDPFGGTFRSVFIDLLHAWKFTPSVGARGGGFHHESDKFYFFAKPSFFAFSEGWFFGGKRNWPFRENFGITHGNS
jgi:hypothetical protein